MAKSRTWKFFSVMMVLALVAALGAAIVPASPVKAASDTFTFTGGSLTTTNTNSWGGYNSHSYGVHFNIDAGPITIEYLGVNAYPINYTGDFGWPPDPTDTGASVIVGVGNGTNSAQYSFKSNMSGDKPRETSPETCGKGSWDHQNIGHWNDDGYRSYLFQGQFTDHWAETVGNSQYNAEKHGGPTGTDPDYDTFDFKFYVGKVAANTYEVTGWHNLWKSSAIDEGCYWDWNYAKNAHDLAKRGYLKCFEGTWTADGGLDLSDIQVFLGIQNWQGTQPGLHTFDWDSVKVTGTVVSPSEIWVDDNWAGHSYGDPADGHVFGYDAFATIQDGVNAVAGSTVNVVAGTYAEAVTIGKANLTLKSVSPLGAIIKPTTSGSNAIYISADGVTVDGFEIDGTTLCKNGILGWETSGLTIKNNKIHGAVNAWDGCGILLFSWGTSGTVFNNLIQGNEVYDTGRMGIMVMDYGGGKYTVTSGNTITGNTVYDTWKVAWGDGGGGIQINVGKNCAITNNVVYDTKNGQRGIYMFGSAAGNTITGNTLRDNPIGIQLWISGEQPTPYINWDEETPTSPQVHFNNIYGNSLYGAKSTNIAGTPMVMDATNNWWGANNGPDDDAGAINGSGDKISINVDANPWIKCTLVANPTQIVADGTSQSDLTAKLKNSDNTIVAPNAQLKQLPQFAKVTFTTDKGIVGSSSVTKDLTDGQATAKLTSSTTVETATVIAQAKDASGNAISGATDNATVNFVAGASFKVTVAASLTSIVANGTSTSTITATVKDQYDHNVVDGTPVVFTTDKGKIGSLTTTKPTANGIATATLTSSATPAVADVTATANGARATTAVIFTTAGAPVTQSNTQTVSGSGTVTTTSTGGDVTIDGTGDHTLTTAKYSGNPGGTPGFQASGNYYDVHLDSAVGVNSLTVKFCPATSSTVIYYWKAGQWVAASNQQYANGCITVTITASTQPNLSDLAGLVFGGGTPTPTPASAPPREQIDDSSYGESHSTTLRSAAMKTRYLNVTPHQVYTNQPVTISTNVISDGGDGSYNVMLRINGQVEQTQAVSVSGGSAKQVKFTVAKSQPGTYTVQVGNEKSMFTVIAGGKVSESTPMNEGVIVLVLFGALLLATVVVLMVAFRRRPV